jgi:hypothetical protein
MTVTFFGGVVLQATERKALRLATTVFHGDIVGFLCDLTA